jgi:hypothetical protein
MNTQTTRTGFCITPWLSLCAVFALASAASAQTQRYYPPAQGGYPQQPQYTQPAPNYQQPPPGYGGYPQQPQTRYENPIEFFPKFSKRMGEMFRKLFYGDDRSGWDYPPPGSGHSLDSRQQPYQAPNRQQTPPPGYYQQPAYQYPQQPGAAQPRYNYPPQQPMTPDGRTPQPPSQSRSTTPPTQGKSSTRTYSPPKVGESASSKSKTQSKPSTIPQPKPPAQETPPPPPTTTRRSESTPQTSSSTSSSGSGSFLKGRKTGKTGRVISPYPPYKELDVTGLESGSLALDPTTQKVFEVP